MSCWNEGTISGDLTTYSDIGETVDTYEIDIANGTVINKGDVYIPCIASIDVKVSFSTDGGGSYDSAISIDPISEHAQGKGYYPVDSTADINVGVDGLFIRVELNSNGTTYREAGMPVILNLVSSPSGGNSMFGGILQ